MQIKASDDRSGDIAALEALATRLGAPPAKRSEIEQELRNIRAGVAGEREAAYEMELYFGRSRNFMTIHDLRFEVDGHAAQIDHLILNRVAEVWICETKHFAEGVSVNEHGEWARFWHGKREGTPSPIDQNRRHELLLQRLFDDGRVRLPKRLGLVRMRPIVRPLVLISNNARIERPRRGAPGLEQVIKIEKLEQTVRGAIDDLPTVAISRALTTSALESFARGLAAVHQPISFDWERRFGLEPLTRPLGGVGSSAVAGPMRADAAVPRRRPSGHRCASCGQPVSFAVAKFCWNNPKRFNGSIYCMDCQATFPAASPSRFS